MPREFTTTEEFVAYVTAENRVNTDRRFLTAGSKNVLIDRQRKVGIRRGIKRLGAGSVAETPIKQEVIWETSTNQKWKMRFYDDEWEVWISTLDGIVVDTFHRVMNGLTVSEIPRLPEGNDVIGIWKDSETLDVALMVQGDANLYEWNGAVAVVKSVSG